MRKRWLFFIFMIGLTLRLLVLYRYGPLSLNSDDMGYVKSSFQLLSNHMLTYHQPDTPTVHIMPGQSFLLAAVFFIFGKGTLGLYAAHLTMIGLGVVSLYFVYRIGAYVKNEAAGLLAAFLCAIFPPFLVINNLLLTETPFICLFLCLLYYSIRLAHEHQMKDFYFVLLFFLAAVFFRTQIAFFPVVLIIYLLLKRYPMKLIKKQLPIAIVVCFLVLLPWWIRNYELYDRFIFLTGGSGDPLLLGSFQGVHVPEDQTIEEIATWAQQKAKKEGPAIQPPYHPDYDPYLMMKYEGDYAKERIKRWMRDDPASFLISYLWVKPKLMMDTQYYPIEIFRISYQEMQTISKSLINPFAMLFVVLSLILLKQERKEMIFFILIIGFNTLLNCIYYAYDRYHLPMMTLIFLIMAIVFTHIVQKVKVRQ